MFPLSHCAQPDWDELLASVDCVMGTEKHVGSEFERTTAATVIAPKHVETFQEHAVVVEQVELLLQVHGSRLSAGRLAVKSSHACCCTVYTASFVPACRLTLVWPAAWPWRP